MKVWIKTIYGIVLIEYLVTSDPWPNNVWRNTLLRQRRMASTSDVKQTPSSQPRELPPAYDAAMAQPSLLPTQPSSQQQVNQIIII